MKQLHPFLYAASFSLLYSVTLIGQAFARPVYVPPPRDGGFSPNYLASTATGVIKGDFNFDNRLDENDIHAFILAMTSTEAYESEYETSPLFKGDFDGNGVIDIDDYYAGLARIFNPIAPSTPTMLIKKSELLQYSLRPTNFPSQSPQLGTIKMSGEGRYVVVEGGHPFSFGVLDSVIVYDTFTLTSFKITVPPGTGFDGFYHESLAISGNGQYIALTGVNLVRDNNENIIGLSSQVFRYNLNTGKVDTIPAVGGDAILESFHPSLSNDGNTLVFRGVVDSGAAEPEVGVYLTRFRAGTRGNETLFITEIDSNTLSTNAIAAPHVSGDGRFALVPYTKTDDVEWEQTTGIAPTHQGLTLYDLETGAVVKVLADGAPYRDSVTREYLTSSRVEQEAFDISRNGNIVAYCRVDYTAGSDERTVTINLYNNRTNTVTLVETVQDPFIAFCPEALHLTDDSTFLTYNGKVYDIRNRSFAALPLPDGVSSLDAYFGSGEISADGCYIGLTGRGEATDNEPASFIVPNPLKSCQ